MIIQENNAMTLMRNDVDSNPLWTSSNSISETIKDKIQERKANKANKADKSDKYSLLQGTTRVDTSTSTSATAKERRIQADFIAGMNQQFETSL
ncbi:hypothetical protein BJ741DRAFT_667328 [Chytriomyces cf. hyalinus JEL632]|nr:hypothetical protein BJ741DRAFT_667328 [Chytriomyces cf. hyalinus JEL632]